MTPTATNSIVSLSETIQPSETSGGTTDAQAVHSRIVSNDGRFVAFANSAGNVLLGQQDANAGTDVFVHDRNTGTTELISHSIQSPLITGNRPSYDPVISADGRFVAFRSNAIDLIAGMTSPYPTSNNVFVYDRLNRACTLVTHQFDAHLTGQTYLADNVNISANGKTIVFESESVNLVPGIIPTTTNPRRTQYEHAYAYNVETRITSLIDHKFGRSDAVESNSAAFSVSADGRYVAFTSRAKDLTALITNKIENVYRYDCSTGQNLLISKSAISGNVSGNNSSRYPQLSDDGSLVVFVSRATDLVVDYVGADDQVFISDVNSSSISLVSRSTAGTKFSGNARSTLPSISGDGSCVAFLSQATDLIANYVDGNGPTGWDIYRFDRKLAENTLLSYKVGTSNMSGNNLVNTSFPAVSNDGNLIGFSARATDLVSNFIDNNGSVYSDAYLYDQTSGLLSLVSGSGSIVSNGGDKHCSSIALSADGGIVVFSTAASNIPAGVHDVNGFDDVFIRDVATSTTSLASRRFGAPSLSAGGESTWVQQSADGRFITFTSYAMNHVAGQIDTGATQDVFLYDRLLNTTTLVSHAFDSPTRAADKESAIPVISADGRYVAYTSYASNLIADFVDNNGDGYPGNEQSSGVDVYLFDRITGINRLVSHIAGVSNVGGNQTSSVYYPYPSELLSISADGRYVGYFSLANDLVAGFIDANGTTPSNNTGSDVYVYDRITDTNTLVSRKAGFVTTGGNDSSYAPSLSGDGRFIAYWSYGYTQVSGMTPAHARNVFVFDQLTGLTTLASHRSDSNTLASNGWSTDPVISKDGKFVVYNSDGTNLIAGQFDANNQDDVFLYDLQTGVNMLVSHKHSSAVTAANAESQIGAPQYGSNAQAISADGRFVVFDGAATDLVSGYVQGYANFPSDVYLFDRLTGASTLVSRSILLPTTGANRTSQFASVSGNGRFVGFESNASDLVSNYQPFSGTLSLGDAYIYDRLAGTIVLASHGLKGPNLGGSGVSLAVTLNHDGSVITYLSSAENLVAGDFNSHQDVVAYVQLPSVQSVTIADGSPQRSVVRSVTMAFDQFIPFAGDPALAFEVRKQGLGNSVQLTAAVVNNPNTTVTLTFSGPGTEFGSLVDGKYQLTVRGGQWAGGISNLDGNNDGFAGDDYVFNFHRLFGDADGNGIVNTVDFGALRNAFASTAFIFDFNNTGSVDIADFDAFRVRFGSSV